MNKEVCIVLDVISSQSYVSLVVDNEIKQFNTYENKNNLSDNLIEYIDATLSSHQYTLQDITKIAQENPKRESYQTLCFLISDGRYGCFIHF